MSANKFLGCFSPYQLALLLEEIDLAFQKSGRPINQREMHAVIEVAKKAGNKEVVFASEGTRVDGGIVADGTFDFICNWYREKYGEKLNMQWSPGDGIILIRGDPYKFGVPRIFGAVHLVCRPNDIGRQAIRIGLEKNLPVYNILNGISGLTRAYALQLENAELQDIWDSCLSIMEYYKEIEQAIDLMKSTEAKRLAEESLGDLQDGTISVFKAHPRYGQVRWDALQAVEKMLKAYLALNGRPYPATHNLQKLINMLPKSLPSIYYDASNVVCVQCDAAVRYAEQISTLQDAVEAWQMALRLCGELCKQIRQEICH